MSLQQAAEIIRSKGRYGDTELVHMNPDEISTLEMLAGHGMTINPHTGQREAFSLWKAIAGIGALIAAPFTGGATAPIGGALLGSAFVRGNDKKKDNRSEAGAYIDQQNAKRRAEMDARGIPITYVDSIQVQPDLLGREQQHFGPNAMTNGIQTSMGGLQDIAMRRAMGGTLEPEEMQAQQVYANAMQQPDHGSLNEFLRVYGPDALNTGGVVKGPGGGMDDMVSGRLGNGGKVLLSKDEFVIPADVVSGLGDGSSEAGANELYAMMARVRKERTGKVKQPKKLNKSKVLPR